MFSKLNSRYIVFLALFAACFLFLTISYHALAVSDSGTEEVSTDSGTRTMEITGLRGSILDKNGIPLAYDTSGYNVQFLIDSSKTASSDYANYTDIFTRTIKLIEKNGGEVIDSFLIKRNENGEYDFDLDFLVSDENDTEGTERRQKRIDNWCTNMYISDATAEPEEMYNELRGRYRIPEDVGYEEAVKLLSIWQEVQLGSYKAYLPVTIAKNVSYSTVIEIETRANELEGMSISRSGVRVYPKGDTAAHVIGYTGSIVEEDDVDALKEKGYDTDEDLIGRTGIESTMEEYLTASTTDKKGSQEIKIDQNKGAGEVISYTAPQNGNDVVLTLDIKMQEVLEEALKNNINAVRQEQEKRYQNKKEDYDEEVKNRKDPSVNMCDSGAAIVIDCNNADILAMASYPSFDLNLFVGGISNEDYEALKNEPSSPFFNNAVSSASTPGSIFKICTGIAGLMEGAITTGSVINDEGPYTEHIKIGGRAPECWVKPNYSAHANNQTIVEALKVSCNYYFYETANRLGIEKLSKWAQNFGLIDEKTGIELPAEAVGQIGSQAVRYDNTKPLNQQKTYTPLLVYNRIVKLLTQYGEERNVDYPEELIKETAEEILKLAGSQGSKRSYGEEIRRIMNEKMEIPERVSKAKRWAEPINQYLTEIIWTDADTVTQGIGVEPTQVTPIAVARYIAAVANGGKVLEPHLVDRVIDSDGNIVYESETTLVRDLKIPQQYLDAVWEGMSEVVSLEDGGAGDFFQNFAYKDILAGKTGTGRVSEVDLENNGWFVCFAPFGENKKPEIAVVVFLPNGISGLSAAPTARDFLQYYFDSKTAVTEVETPGEGTLAE